jgi:biotin synthase-like enzyme
MPEHPESFPVNALVPIKGTPLENNEVGIPPCIFSLSLALNDSQPVSHHVLLRTIATARIVLPTTIIRLAAGRQWLSENEQAMCFMAGANAVFTGDQMLTTPCEWMRTLLSMELNVNCVLDMHRLTLGRGRLLRITCSTTFSTLHRIKL